jgi:hypothetical protein
MIKPDSNSQIVELKPPFACHLTDSATIAGILLIFTALIQLCYLLFAVPFSIELLIPPLLLWIGLTASYPLTTVEVTPYSVKGPGGKWGVLSITVIQLDMVDVQASYGHSDHKWFLQPYAIQSVTGNEKIALTSAFTKEQFNELMGYISERQKEMGVYQLKKTESKADLT